MFLKVVLEKVSPDKDVDGLHPLSLAALATTQTHRNPGKLDPTWSSVGFNVACTALGASSRFICPPAFDFTTRAHIIPSIKQKSPFGRKKIQNGIF